jgi:hypothetical protein
MCLPKPKWCLHAGPDGKEEDADHDAEKGEEGDETHAAVSAVARGIPAAQDLLKRKHEREN